MAENQVRVVKPHQAVILAGGLGNRMYPLTCGLSKSFLPVGNRPLIAYQLYLLESNGFSDVVIITKSEFFKAMTDFVENQAIIDSKCVKVVACDATGTADVLRACSGDLRKDSDFLVQSGDVISTDNLNNLCAYHVFRGALATSLFKRTSSTTVAVVKGKKDHDEDMSTQVVGFDETTSQLLYGKMQYATQNIALKKDILLQHPAITFKSDLQHAHIYVFNSRVLEVLKENPTISSIQSDLVPFLITSQHLPQTEEVRNKVYLYLASDACLLERVNNIPMYVALNYRVMRDEEPLNWPLSAEHNFAVQAKENCKTASLNSCLVGDDLKLEPSTSTNSIIGTHCRIGKGVRLTNCIVGDYCVIEPGAILSDCILMHNVNIHAKAVLKNCRLSANVTISEGQQLEGELIQDSTWSNSNEQSEE